MAGVAAELEQAMLLWELAVAPVTLGHFGLVQVGAQVRLEGRHFVESVVQQIELEFVPGDLVDLQAFVVQNNIGGRARFACGQCARSGVDTKLLKKLVTSESYREVPSDVFGRFPEEGLFSLYSHRQVVYQLQESISGFLASGFVFQPLHRVVHVTWQRMLFRKLFHEFCMRQRTGLRLDKSAVLITEDELVKSEITCSLLFDRCRHG
jgi:hypothetical protein